MYDCVSDIETNKKIYRIVNSLLVKGTIFMMTFIW